MMESASNYTAAVDPAALDTTIDLVEDGPDLTDREDFSNELSLNMKSRLNKNDHREKTNTFNKEIPKTELDTLIANENSFAKAALSVNDSRGYADQESLSCFLLVAIPSSAPKAIGKGNFIDFFISIRRVLCIVLSRTKFSRALE